MERVILGALTKWRFVQDGGLVKFWGTVPRTVVIDVNSDGPVSYYCSLDEDALMRSRQAIADERAGRERPDLGESLFLIGCVSGRGRLEFSVAGSFELIVSGGDCYVFSNALLDVATERVGELIYTRIANRRQRNPHLEMMDYLMKQNQVRFFNQLSAENERRLSDLEKKYAPARNKRAPASLVGGPDGAELGEAGSLSEDGNGGGQPDDASEGRGVSGGVSPAIAAGKPKGAQGASAGAKLPPDV